MRPTLAALAALLALACTGCVPRMASARDFGQWASQPQEIRDWYKNAELTPEAQKRFPFKKCCDNADVVRTNFRVDKTSGADEWFWLDGETWKRIPPDIIHWGESAPDGRPTLFVYSGKETCFFPGESGN
jgi:hypothetical protein